MKQRMKQLEFQEKLRQKLDVADVNQNSPVLAVCSTTPTGRWIYLEYIKSLYVISVLLTNALPS